MTAEGKRRWIRRLQHHGEAPEIDAFLDAIERVCREHGLSIGHEDGHGAFLIDDFSDSDIEWLREASDNRASGEVKLAVVRVVPGASIAPTAWKHTLHMEFDQTIDRFTDSPTHPFGKPGENYSEEYTVSSTPLYSEPGR